MNNINLRFILISLVLALSSCKQYVQETEMRGELTTFVKAYGNSYLEVSDVESHQTRFIHPGKKIIQILPGSSKIRINIMDSKRLRLASINVPKKLYTDQSKKNEFYMETSKIDPKETGGALMFDIKGYLTPVDLKYEYVERTGAETCNIPHCKGKNCIGLRGPLWEVVDRRNNYRIEFLTKYLHDVWGRFDSHGDTVVYSREVQMDKCVPRVRVLQVQDMEDFR